MSIILKNLSKYIAIFILITVSISIGIISTISPNIDQYSAEIKGWLNENNNYEIDFKEMSASWSIEGPELILANPVIREKSSRLNIIEMEELIASIGFVDFIMGRAVTPNQLKFRNLEIDISFSPAGDLLFQGLSSVNLTELIGHKNNTSSNLNVEGEIVLLNISLPSQEEINLSIPRIQIERNNNEINLETDFILPEIFGNSIFLSASKRISQVNSSSEWILYIEGEELDIQHWMNAAEVKNGNAINGKLNIQSWFEFDLDNLNRMTADISLNELTNQNSRKKSLDIKSRIEFSDNEFGWFAVADKFQLSRENGFSPESRIEVQINENKIDGRTTLDSNISFLDLRDLSSISAVIENKFLSDFLKLQPSGQLKNTKINISDLREPNNRFDISTDFDDLGLLVTTNKNQEINKLNIEGGSGKFFLNQTGGRLDLSTQDLLITSDYYFDGNLSLSSAEGAIIWRKNEQGILILSDNIMLQNPFFDIATSFEISWLDGQRTPYADIEGYWNVEDVDQFVKFLPKKTFNPVLYEWAQNAFLSGKITNGSVRLVGLLEKFPFRKNDGIFQIKALAEDLALNYADTWPDAKVKNMEFTIDSAHIYSLKNESLHAGMKVEDAIIEIKDLSNPVFEMQASSSAQLNTINNFLISSPIDKYFGGMLRNISSLGEAEYFVDVSMPLRVKERINYDYTANFRLKDVTLDIDGLNPKIHNINGSASISRHDISTEIMTGSWIGSDIKITARKAFTDEKDLSGVISVTGVTEINDIDKNFNSSLKESLSGSTDYTLNINVPRYSENPQPFFINLNANIDSIDISLPRPIRDLKEDNKFIDMDIYFPEDSSLVLQGKVGSDISWNIDYAKDENIWELKKGTLTFGSVDYKPADSRGIHIKGTTDYINFNDWYELLLRENDKSDDNPQSGLIRSVDLKMNEFIFYDRVLSEQNFIVNKGSSEWIIEAEGSDAQGYINLPYRFDEDIPIELVMERLYLNQVADSSGVNILDPRTLPSIILKLEDFSFSNYHLGSIDGSFLKTKDGLIAEELIAKNDSFEMIGNIGWLYDETSDKKAKTHMGLILKSDDVADTLSKFDYQPVIQSDDLEIQIDLDWDGSPFDEFLESLVGSFNLRLGSGQLEEIDPGAGRVFGLLSIVALPRRLSLDFRDVIERGLGFDEILASFIINNGIASTCNLSLKGPAADVGVIGNVDLVKMRYNQAAIVSTNIGNTLPIVGAVVAGPPAAAALLIFSQVFKKPLQEMAQIYYNIQGPFADPMVNNSNASIFSSMSEAFMCTQTQN